MTSITQDNLQIYSEYFGKYLIAIEVGASAVLGQSITEAADASVRIPGTQEERVWLTLVTARTSGVFLNQNP